MKKKIYNLGLNDFARLFGAEASEFPETCRKIIKKSDFRYVKVSAGERDKLIRKINKKMDGGDLFSAGKDSRAVWQKRWSNQLKNFVAENLRVAALAPEYFNKPAHNLYYRLGHSFITPCDKKFEFNWHKVYKYWLFNKYLKNIDNVYEFGCGTGTTAALLAEMFPQKRLCCLDWAASSVDIIRLLAKKYNWSLTGRFFDMSSPDPKLKVEKNSAFLAISSLEQLGTNYKAFVRFAIKKRVALFITMDSIEELYDDTDPYDRLAIKFIKKRNFLSNYLNYLRRLETKKKIEILEVLRVGFGNIYHDLSHIIWRPMKRQNKITSNQRSRS